jgi:hypothetical protein
VRVLLADFVEDIVIQLVERNPAILVPVRIPGGQSLDQGAGEHRRRTVLVVGELFPFEGVLHRAPGGWSRRAPCWPGTAG